MELLKEHTKLPLVGRAAQGRFPIRLRASAPSPDRIKGRQEKNLYEELDAHKARLAQCEGLTHFPYLNYLWDPVNLGTGKEITIRGLPGGITEAAGFSGGIRWDTGKRSSTQ